MLGLFILSLPTTTEREEDSSSFTSALQHQHKAKEDLIGCQEGYEKPRHIRKGCTVVCEPNSLKSCEVTVMKFS